MTVDDGRCGEMAGKAKEFLCEGASVDRVWTACVQAVGVLGYNVLSSDSGSKQISFNTGRSMSSWGGQDLSATLIAVGSDTKLLMGGSLAKTGNPFGGGAQLGSWGEKSRLIDNFAEEVRKLLPDIPEPVTLASTAAEDIPTQIQKLGDLHKQGLLTDDEFAAKKQDLLNRM